MIKNDDVSGILTRQGNKAKNIFNETKSIFCSFFDKKIILNSDGLHHLKYSSRKERPKQEQLLKLNLLPLGLKIIGRAGTVQEYRANLIKIGQPSGLSRLYSTKKVEYWGFVAICHTKRKDYDIKIKVILKRIGNGNIHFWSLMPYGNINNQKLYDTGIEDV